MLRALIVTTHGEPGRVSNEVISVPGHGIIYNYFKLDAPELEVFLRDAKRAWGVAIIDIEKGENDEKA